MDDCSDWSQQRRRIAWLIRFAQFIHDRKSVKSGGLSTEDYEAATNAIARIVQSQTYGSEILDLKAGKHVKSSKIAHLNPVIDDSGVLKCLKMRFTFRGEKMFRFHKKEKNLELFECPKIGGFDGKCL